MNENKDSAPVEPEETIDEPVMDGANDHSDIDRDPREGLSDPGLIRDVDSKKKTVNPYG